MQECEWNAGHLEFLESSNIIGIFTHSQLSAFPIGLMRYMIHGLPEIASYFIAALAGGIISVAIIKREVGTDSFWGTLQDSLNLIIFSVIILFIAAITEVFITPIFF